MTYPRTERFPTVFPHKEFEIKVMAPNEIGECKWSGCKYTGSFAISCTNDHGNLVFFIDPICEIHLMSAFLDAFQEA
jgi:hypothetical protein